MKIIAMALVVWVVSVSAMGATDSEAWQNPRFDVNGQGTWVIPTGDNDAEWIGMLELKGIYWAKPKFGMGLSIGFGSWSDDADGVLPPYDLPELEDDDSTIYIGTIPIGASLYFRPLVKNRFALNLETGVRYMAAWEDVGVEYDGETVIGDDDISIYIQHDGDADSGWVAVFNLDFEYQIGGNFYAGLGAGYQVDLSDQTYTLWGEEHDLSYEGVGIRATLGGRF